MHKAETSITPARVLFPLGLGTALSLMGDATLYTVLPTHTQVVGITLTQVGIMLGINRAIRLISNGSAGLAYDRYPRRSLFVPALFLGAISTAIYALARGFWPLLAGRLLWGIAWSGIWVGGTTMILDVTSELDRGKWTGLYQIWFFIGTALGSLSGGVLTDLLGYYGTMWVCASITGVGALIALWFLPETRPDLKLTRYRSTAPVNMTGTATDQSVAHDRSLPPFRSKKDKSGFTFVVCLRGVNRFIIAGILSATLSLLVMDRLSADSLFIGIATLTGFLMAGRTVMSMLGAILAGAGSDLLRNRWVVLAFGLTLSVISMLLLSSQTGVVIFFGVAVAALARGGIQALTTSLTGDLVTATGRGRAVGVLHTVGDFGSAIGPSVAYFLLPFWGLSNIYVLCAVLFGLCLVVNLVMLKARAGPQI